MFSRKRNRCPLMHLFYISDITNSSSYSGKKSRKKFMLENFSLRSWGYCIGAREIKFWRRSLILFAASPLVAAPPPKLSFARAYTMPPATQARKFWHELPPPPLLSLFFVRSLASIRIQSQMKTSRTDRKFCQRFNGVISAIPFISSTLHSSCCCKSFSSLCQRSFFDLPPITQFPEFSPIEEFTCTLRRPEITFPIKNAVLCFNSRDLGMNRLTSAPDLPGFNTSPVL